MECQSHLLSAPADAATTAIKRLERAALPFELVEKAEKEEKAEEVARLNTHPLVNMKCHGDRTEILNRNHQ